MSDITITDVKNALDRMDDLIYLEACGLAKVRYIMVKKQRNLRISKGVLVRDFLKEALKQMQPQGLRSEMAPEWRLYTILDYRYFKQMPNNQVMAHLGITSMRQYYREKDRAIKLFHRTLLQIDTGSE